MTKHTILFLAANPVGTDRFALDREARAIQVEVERSGHRDQFELVTRWAAEPLDLLRELRKLKPTVVHFSGHGTSDVAGASRAAEGTHRDVVIEHRSAELGKDGLYFQCPDGRAQLVSAEALARVFGAAGASVKLVVLSACHSDPQAAALAAHVDCVVGMRGSIPDDAARSFAIGFYGGLGERESVAAAYRQGCAAIGLEGLPDGDKPRLKVRDGVDAELVVLADRAGGDPSELSHRVVSPPTPAYANAEVEALSKQLEDARARKQKLRDAELATDHLDREILELRRQLREGGQLRAGDALSDGRYLLVKVVGRGGFAVVWEAYDHVERQRVAIKVLHSNLAGDPLRRERFFRGAQAMMNLRHPSIVRVLAPKGEDGGFYYFVMEFVPSGNLREAVLDNRLGTGASLALILRIGEALALAHSRGIIHRDVKPSNIVLGDAGEAKLTDFDLVGAHDTTGGTRTGALGTVVYAAPECLEKPQDATARADVYGLGMTAIFCLAGKELSLSTFKNPDPTIAKLRCSAKVRDVLRRAVAWEPDARFADADALAAELRDALDRAATEDAGHGQTHDAAAPAAVNTAEFPSHGPGEDSAHEPARERGDPPVSDGGKVAVDERAPAAALATGWQGGLTASILRAGGANSAVSAAFADTAVRMPEPSNDLILAMYPPRLTPLQPRTSPPPTTPATLPMPDKPTQPAAVADSTSPPAAMDHGRLFVISSRFAGREFVLSKTRMVIGRRSGADIFIDDRSISRDHAEIVRDSETGRYVIRDRTSDRGVRVNGSDYGKVELRRRDIIDLGDVRLRFVEPGEDFVFARDEFEQDRRRSMRVAVVLLIALVATSVALYALLLR